MNLIYELIFGTHKFTHPTQELKQERILNLSDPKIVIGVNSYIPEELKEDPNKSKMALQKIKINDEKLKCLIRFTVYETKYCKTLSFGFEENLIVNFYRFSDGIIYITINKLENEEKRFIMDPHIREYFKNISFSSPEFDEIGEFIK